jgi:hypothetical protein
MTEDDIATLKRIATHISTTLYYNSDHLGKAYSDVIAKDFIRHDDYDLLRDIARRAEIDMLQARLKELGA